MIRDFMPSAFGFEPLPPERAQEADDEPTFSVGDHLHIFLPRSEFELGDDKVHPGVIVRTTATKAVVQVGTVPLVIPYATLKHLVIEPVSSPGPDPHTPDTGMGPEMQQMPHSSRAAGGGADPEEAYAARLAEQQQQQRASSSVPVTATIESLQRRLKPESLDFDLVYELIDGSRTYPEATHRVSDVCCQQVLSAKDILDEFRAKAPRHMLHKRLDDLSEREVKALARIVSRQYTAEAGVLNASITQALEDLKRQERLQRAEEDRVRAQAQAQAKAQAQAQAQARQEAMRRQSSQSESPAAPRLDPHHHQEDAEQSQTTDAHRASQPASIASRYERAGAGEGGAETEADTQPRSGTGSQRSRLDPRRWLRSSRRSSRKGKVANGDEPSAAEAEAAAGEGTNQAASERGDDLRDSMAMDIDGEATGQGDTSPQRTADAAGEPMHHPEPGASTGLLPFDDDGLSSPEIPSLERMLSNAAPSRFHRALSEMGRALFDDTLRTEQDGIAFVRAKQDEVESAVEIGDFVDVRVHESMQWVTAQVERLSRDSEGNLWVKVSHSVPSMGAEWVPVGSGRIALPGRFSNPSSSNYMFGDRVDILDRFPHKRTGLITTKWRTGSIIDVFPGHVRVHFDGWDHTFDEDINLQTDGYRVRPLGRHTHQDPDVVEKRRLEQQFLDRLAFVDPPLTIHEIPGDGNCLFRSIAHQLFGAETTHMKIRHSCMDHIYSNKHRFSGFIAEPVDVYCARMRQSGEWGDEVELAALSEILDRPIEVYSLDTPLTPDGRIQPRQLINNSTVRGRSPIRLTYHDGAHYNSLIPLGDWVPLARASSAP